MWNLECKPHIITAVQGQNVAEWKYSNIYNTSLWNSKRQRAITGLLSVLLSIGYIFSSYDTTNIFRSNSFKDARSCWDHIQIYTLLYFATVPFQS